MLTLEQLQSDVTLPHVGLEDLQPLLIVLAHLAAVQIHFVHVSLQVPSSILRLLFQRFLLVSPRLTLSLLCGGGLRLPRSLLFLHDGSVPNLIDMLFEVLVHDSCSVLVQRLVLTLHTFFITLE